MSLPVRSLTVSLFLALLLQRLAFLFELGIVKDRVELPILERHSLSDVGIERQCELMRFFFVILVKRRDERFLPLVQIRDPFASHVGKERVQPCGKQHIFTPKFKMTTYVALFLCALIKKEKYRFSYGRKWGIERMKISTIKLPADSRGGPDLAFIEHFMSTLPYSSQIDS